jgi:hypothetical protein
MKFEFENMITTGDIDDKTLDVGGLVEGVLYRRLDKFGAVLDRVYFVKNGHIRVIHSGDSLVIQHIEAYTNTTFVRAEVGVEVTIRLRGAS